MTTPAKPKMTTQEKVDAYRASLADMTTPATAPQPRRRSHRPLTTKGVIVEAVKYACCLDTKPHEHGWGKATPMDKQPTAQHTPGPSQSALNAAMAACGHSPTRRLIAAAPELLAALEDAIGALEDKYGPDAVCVEEARAAIRKAKGE